MTSPVRVAVVVAGLPGTGKSTFAQHLADAVPRTVVVDKDAIVSPLVEAALRGASEDVDLDGDFYKRHLSPAAYEVVEAVASAVLAAGSTPIVVAPYERALDDPGWPDRLGERLDARVVAVWLHARPEVVRDRLARRGLDRDRRKLADWDAYVGRTAFGRAPPWPHRRVDTTAPTARDWQDAVSGAAEAVERTIRPRQS